MRLGFLQCGPEENRKVLNGKVQSLLTPRESRMSKQKVKTMLICCFDIRGIILYHFVLRKVSQVFCIYKTEFLMVVALKVSFFWDIQGLDKIIGSLQILYTFLY
jgi:hypothetical protein